MGYVIEKLWTEYNGRNYEHGEVKIEMKSGDPECNTAAELNLTISKEQAQEFVKELEQLVRKYAL